MIVTMKRTRDVIDESRSVNDGLKKHCKQIQRSLHALEKVIVIEDKKLARIENNNDLRGMSIQELAGPVIRMRGVEQNMKEVLSDMRRFFENCESKSDKMESELYEEEAANEALEFEQDERNNVIMRADRETHRQAVIYHNS